MEKKVQIIAASLDKVNRNKGKNTSKIRVAPYCRVSTNSEEQKNSYDSQLSYYKDLVDKKEEWELVDIYADEAISGTQTFNRTDFQRMISDALSGKIDLIVTKSISRFARNTLDTLKYVRMLKEKDVAIFFEKENINTLTMNGELLLVILSSVAQQESESISGNVKLGLKMKMKRGELVGFNKCLGYDYDKEDKSISINEEDAEIVKYIFERYSNGVGSFVIAKELTNLNYPTPNGLKYWQESTIRGILKNEKYKGDLLLGKTFTIDPITHRRLVNFGEVEKYYIKGHHEAIISEELFDKVQKITKKRKDGQNQSGRKEMYTRKYSFSGITKCGYCGATFMRRTWHSGSPHEKGVWSCHTHTKYGKQHCLSSKSISNQILESTFVDAYNLICKSNKELIADYLEVIQKAINHTSNVEEISKIEKNIELIDKKLKNLLEMKLNEEIDLCTYKEKNAQLNIEMFKLKARIDELNIYSSKEEEVNKRIMQFKKLFDEETTMKSFDREIFDCLVEKVIIGETSEDGTIEPYNIRFIFKTGNSVDTNIENNVKIKKRDKSLKVFSNQTDDTCRKCCITRKKIGDSMKSSYNLEYKIVKLDNFNITFNIQKNIWPDDIDYDDVYDKAANTKEDNCLFLVYDNNILIGLTGVDVFEEYPDTIWLDWLAVLPEHRRKGYGEKILKDTIEYCTCLNKFKSFRVETTYYENRPALFLYDKIMQLKEEYTIEDKDKKHNTLIYSYPLDGNLEPWNNRYLGLREYYDNLDKKWRKYESINT